MIRSSKGLVSFGFDEKIANCSFNDHLMMIFKNMKNSRFRNKFDTKAENRKRMTEFLLTIFLEHKNNILYFFERP